DLFESGNQNTSSPYDDGEGPSDDAGEVNMKHHSTDAAEEQTFDDVNHAASSMDDIPISEGNVPVSQNVSVSLNLLSRTRKFGHSTMELRSSIS
ncbi:hypothetical protein Tco_0229551, partial [Tanacetum coccineum]